MDAYELHEARFVQEYAATSAANGLTLDTPVVPAGKVRTIISASLGPSVNETQVVGFQIIGRSTYQHTVTVPVSIALTVAYMFPFLTEGMECKLFPGEKLRAFRGAATAGSTISLNVRFIESDLPFYSYEEPLNKVVKAGQKHGSQYRSSGGISIGGGGASGSGGPSGGGGGHSGEPI